MINNVLLTGYTAFLTDAFVAAAFPNSRILIAGETQMQSSFSRKISVYTGALTREICQKFSQTYEFNQVVFFSHSIAPFRDIDGAELETLSLVLDICSLDTQVLYFAGPRHPPGAACAVLENAAQTLCRRASYRTGGVNAVISPWVYAPDAVQPTLQALFQPGTHRLDCPAGQEISFLAAEDLSLLIFRLFENWEESREDYEIPRFFTCTVSRFTELIQKETTDARQRFLFADGEAYPLPQVSSNTLRKRYAWFPVYSILEDLPAIAQFYRNLHRGGIAEKLARLKVNSTVLRIAEQLVAFGLLQLVLKLTHVSIQFQMIDFRLLYIVTMGTMYNIPMGLGAAALASLSLIYEYARNGIGWLTLFYEPTNWLPFIAYFSLGALCGYIRSKDSYLLQSVTNEKNSLVERYNYLEQLNLDVLQEKQEYKQQIIGSRDSFGKIFSISQQLNYLHPRQLFSHSLEVLETVMQNNHVAIYSCPGQTPYGRLAVSSADLHLPHSLPMAPYYEKLNQVQAGEVWVNRELDEQLPVYLYGIRQEGKLAVIILIQSAPYDQLTLYYENLFRVICGLISNSLINAMQYQEAVRHTKCVEGTDNVLSAPYFLEELEIALRAMEQKQSTHLLLHILSDGNSSANQMGCRLADCIRTSDIIGLYKGSIYVLLSQARPSDLPIISKRLEAAGLQYRLLDASQQAELLGEGAEIAHV